MHKTSEGYRIGQKPIQELKKLRKEIFTLKNIILDSSKKTIPMSEVQEILVEFESGNALNFGIKIFKSQTEETIINYNQQKNEISLDRKNSGKVNFHSEFPEKHSAFLMEKQKKLKMQIIVDHSSVELFVNNGIITITDQVFPAGQDHLLEIYAINGVVKVKQIEMYNLKSVWDD